MGIQIEFNPDLCLRAFGTQGRLLEECLPEKLEKKVYAFVKRGLRNFYLLGEIPLRETKGNGELSRPMASVLILEYRHKLDKKNNPFTKGLYKIIESYDANDSQIHFEGFEKT
ncbi:hypothetical protein J4456_04115 [Candidatus Pacearchaeota archaeon]|nr:hypothetical protein [Candidatus Pacearchaeota archaeon]